MDQAVFTAAAALIRKDAVNWAQISEAGRILRLLHRLFSVSLRSGRILLPAAIVLLSYSRHR